MYGRRAQKKRYGILLALIAAAILIIGLLFKPGQTTHPSPETTRTEALRHDVDTLRELAQRNTLRTTSSRFSAMAQADAEFIYSASDGRTALLWSKDSLLLTAGGSPPASTQIFVNGKEIPAAPKLWGAGLPFTLYQAANLEATPASTLKLEDLEPGTWMVVDSVGSNGPEFVTGMYSGTSKTTCNGIDYDKILLNAPFDPRFSGSGMFDIDGDLVAVLAQCDGEVAALPVEQIAAHIADLRRPAQVPFAHLGFVAQPMDAPFDRLLHATTGLVVTDVWMRWPAALSGLMPGDVILFINNTPASTAQQLASALGNLPVQLRVQHASATLQTLTLSSDQARAGFAVQQATSAPVTLTSVSASLTAASGLRAGDQVLQVNGRPASARSLTETLAVTQSAPQSAVLTIQRGPRQFLAVVNR